MTSVHDPIVNLTTSNQPLSELEKILLDEPIDPETTNFGIQNLVSNENVSMQFINDHPGIFFKKFTTYDYKSNRTQDDLFVDNTIFDRSGLSLLSSKRLSLPFILKNHTVNWRWDGIIYNSDVTFNMTIIYPSGCIDNKGKYHRPRSRSVDYKPSTRLTYRFGKITRESYPNWGLTSIDHLTGVTESWITMSILMEGTFNCHYGVVSVAVYEHLKHKFKVNYRKLSNNPNFTEYALNHPDLNWDWMVIEVHLKPHLYDKYLTLLSTDIIPFNASTLVGLGDMDKLISLSVFRKFYTSFKWEESGMFRQIPMNFDIFVKEYLNDTISVSDTNLRLQQYNDNLGLKLKDILNNLNYKWNAFSISCNPAIKVKDIMTYLRSSQSYKDHEVNKRPIWSIHGMYQNHTLTAVDKRDIKMLIKHPMIENNPSFINIESERAYIYNYFKHDPSLKTLHIHRMSELRRNRTIEQRNGAKLLRIVKDPNFWIWYCSELGPGRKIDVSKMISLRIDF